MPIRHAISVLTGRRHVLVPTGSDVAACVDAPRHTRKAAQFVAGQVDRPPLDEPGRVEARHTVRVRQQRREGAARELLRLTTDAGRLVDERVAIAQRQFAAPQPAHLGVRRPRGEDLVHPGKEGVCRRHGLLDLRPGQVVTAQVDAHRHPHVVLDPGPAGHKLALSIADCSDWM
jgi:hypothetical protein